MRVTMEHQADLIAWAEPHFEVPAGSMPPETVALGVIDDKGAILAVICINAFYSHYCTMHVASNGSRRWLTRTVLRCIFGYVFELLGLLRVNIIVSVDNVPIQILALKLGFRMEGYARCGADDGSDGIILGMLASECPWLKEVDDGKEIEQRAVA